MPLPTATNPETGEKIVFVDGEWKLYTQTATNREGQKAYLVGSDWVKEPKAPKTYPQKVAGAVTEFAREVVNPILAPYATVGGAGFLAGGPAGAAVGVGGLLAGDIAASVAGMKTPSQAIRELYGPEIVGEPTGEFTGALRTVGEFAVPGAAVPRAAATVARGVRPAADLRDPFTQRIESREVTDPFARYSQSLLGQSQAPLVEPGVTRNVLATLADQPGIQTVSAVGAGAATAGAQQLGADPYGEMLAGLVGGVVPSTAAAAGKFAGRPVYSLVEPLTAQGGQRVRAAAILNAFENDTMRLQAAIDMLESGMTPEQIAVRTNNSAFASLLGTTRFAKPNITDMYRARDAALNQRLESELAQINQQVLNEKGRLEGQAEALGRGVAGADQPALGRRITTAREKELDKVRREVVSPAYRAAFNAAPEPFSIEPVLLTARQIQADPLTKLNPILGANTTKILQEYKLVVPEDPRAIRGSVGGERPPATPVAPKLTLEGVDNIIKAINMDIGPLMGKVDSEATKTLANLYALRASVDEAITAGVTPQARDLYKEALNLYATRVAQVFNEGWVANLAREGATGVQMVAPAKVVETIINPRDPDNARRFVLALGDNKNAMQATKQGIIDLYKRTVVKGGQVSPEKHEQFMRDHAGAFGILDNAGMGVRAELNKFGKVAKGIEAQQARIEDLSRYIAQKTAGLTATPAQSAQRVTAAVLDEPELRKAVEEISAALQDQQAFQRLVNDAARASGVSPGKIVPQERDIPPFLDSNVMVANWLVARMRGKLDLEQAADLAVELLNSNTAARALRNALEERVFTVFGREVGKRRKAFERGPVGEALFSPYKFPAAAGAFPGVPASISREERNNLAPRSGDVTVTRIGNRLIEP